MLFRIKIDTTNAASFSHTTGFPYWMEKMDTVLELPFHWSRKECTDSLASFFKSVHVVPYQNLAGYEDRIAEVERLLLMISDTLKNWDDADSVSFTSTTKIEDGKFYVSVEEVPY